MAKPIDAKNWQRRNAVRHARALLGKTLVRQYPDGRVEARLITEVEAYDGESDLACHAAKGRTRWTEYVYLCGFVA